MTRGIKRLKLLIVLFCIAVSLPLTYVIVRTYQGLHREEQAQLSYFGEALFDEMQSELTDLIRREERRPVEEYHYTLADKATSPLNEDQRSPLAQVPSEHYILGYLQNNPDGSFQTPLVNDPENSPDRYRDLIEALEAINRAFNLKKTTLAKAAVRAEPLLPKAAEKEKKAESIADRYLTSSQRKAPTSYLGQKSVRTEEITARQAANIAQDDRTVYKGSQAERAEAQSEKKDSPIVQPGSAASPEARLVETLSEAQEGAQMPPASAAAERFQVEVAPMQSVFIDSEKVFIFRRIVINQQIFRQGFVLKLPSFLVHLIAAHFDAQPMAGFTRLNLTVLDHGHQSEMIHAGSAPGTARFVAGRTFPAPFGFLSAELRADAVPTSATRQALNIALIVLALFMLLGLFAIYQSARAVVELSERRSQFVSSVTHELKTPLTNIRMYIEMLEQGIAATPEREQDYLAIVESESARLSRLINNVLEMSKLEKKQRHLDMRPGQLGDVLTEVQHIMSPKLDQNGFELEIRAQQATLLPYDREVMIQVLINLVENSIKFGRQSAQRRIVISVASEQGWVHIDVADTGPGIPRKALKRVFDDFYRADNDLSRTTGGTGIGLALVKKYIVAMGGRVRAVNNAGPGCTIRLSLPSNPK